MSEEELEDKLEKGDFSVFTQRASTAYYFRNPFFTYLLMVSDVTVSTVISPHVHPWKCRVDMSGFLAR